MPIYLDHAATTPMRSEVIEEMTHVMLEEFGNPSSVHAFGRKSSKKLRESRKLIADFLRCRPHEIVFNSGGTEGNNTAILGTAFFRKNKGKHIITTQMEHHSVLHTMEYLEREHGFEITYLSINEKGQISLEEFENSLREDTILVSIMYANNEIGNLLPIRKIGEYLKNHSAVFHVDAVQSFGHEEIFPHEIGINLMSVSAHKFNGPKGAGFLFISDEIQISPLLFGGEQEEKRRAGTENIVGIAGMAKAVELLSHDEQIRQREHFKLLGKRFLEILDQEKISYKINGELTQKVPHILNLHFPNLSSELLLMKLDLAGIAISAGSACTAGNIEPSHVLRAMYGEAADEVEESVRVSLGYNTKIEEVEKLAQELVKICKERA
ncbi:cysteine desulfurase family protein [Pilibacter termitis]|nr:cysteine desulfurase family protein [Pilibacter termitis]